MYKRKLGAWPYENYNSKILDQVLSKELLKKVEGCSEIQVIIYHMEYWTINSMGISSERMCTNYLFNQRRKCVCFFGQYLWKMGFSSRSSRFTTICKKLFGQTGNVAIFPNNLPGNGWIYSMLKRHNNATVKNFC